MEPSSSDRRRSCLRRSSIYELKHGDVDVVTTTPDDTCVDFRCLSVSDGKEREPCSNGTGSVLEWDWLRAWAGATHETSAHVARAASQRSPLSVTRPFCTSPNSPAFRAASTRCGSGTPISVATSAVGLAAGSL